ncbi:MAG: hypothetical protein AAF809_00620 [Bacteroidota bacterium]
MERVAEVRLVERERVVPWLRLCSVQRVEASRARRVSIARALVGAAARKAVERVVEIAPEVAVEDVAGRRGVLRGEGGWGEEQAQGRHRDG